MVELGHFASDAAQLWPSSGQTQPNTTEFVSPVANRHRCVHRCSDTLEDSLSVWSAPLSLTATLPDLGRYGASRSCGGKGGRRLAGGDPHGGRFGERRCAAGHLDVQHMCCPAQMRTTACSAVWAPFPHAPGRKRLGIHADTKAKIIQKEVRTEGGLQSLNIVRVRPRPLPSRFDGVAVKAEVWEGLQVT